jgi:hypothetical protein
MTAKTKKTTAPEPETALDQIVARLRTALKRESENVIEIGNLLVECREHVPHGDWQAWLAGNFALSYRTAHRYENAAEYVAGKLKSDTVADFANLSPTVLYRLAEGDYYSEQEETAILAATSEGRVGTTRADEICDALAPPDAGDQEDGDQEDGDQEDGSELAAEAAAIIDGPPPAGVPPPAPNPPPTDFAVQDFNRAISTLKRLMTKPAAQFAKTNHGADVLRSVEDFIRAVMTASGAARCHAATSEATEAAAK